MPNLVEIGPVVLEKNIVKFRQCIFSILKLFPLRNSGALHLNRLDSPSHTDNLCQVWLKLTHWFWRRRFLNFVNVFLLFHNYPPLEKGRTLNLNKLGSPSQKEVLCQVWLKLVQWFLRRRVFLISSMYFCYFVIISPWKTTGPFI